MAATGQLGRLAGVGDEPSLYKDRRNIGRLQHHEASLLHTLLVQGGDAAHVAQHFLPDIQAGAERGRHRQVEQHTREHAVLVVEADVAGAPDQVGTVFRVCQPACGFGSSATVGQGKYRCAERSLGRRGVGVDRNEQVGALLAGDFGAFAQRNEVVTGAGQLGAEALFRVDLALQLLGNLQHDVFFMLAARAGSTGSSPP